MAEKTLKQDEIDALFEAARSAVPEEARTEVRARVVPYNFASSGQISTEQLRAISMLNDLFARNLTHNLAAWPCLMRRECRKRGRTPHAGARRLCGLSGLGEKWNPLFE